MEGQEEEKEEAKYKGDKPELVFEEEQRAMMNKAQERTRLKSRLRKRSAIFDTRTDQKKSDGPQDGKKVDLTEMFGDLEEDEDILGDEEKGQLEHERIMMQKFAKASVEVKDYCTKAFDFRNDPLGYMESVKNSLSLGENQDNK